MRNRDYKSATQWAQLGILQPEVRPTSAGLMVMGNFRRVGQNYQVNGMDGGYRLKRGTCRAEVCLKGGKTAFRCKTKTKMCGKNSPKQLGKQKTPARKLSPGNEAVPFISRANPKCDCPVAFGNSTRILYSILVMKREP